MSCKARVVLLSTTACVFSLSALAADLPTREAPVAPSAPVVYAPAFSWTGFYVGGELGWIRTKSNYTPGAVILGAPFVVSSLPASDKNGATYGLMAGYNYQAGQFVFGVEGDLTGWTVGEAKLRAACRRFHHGAQQMGRLDPRAVRLRCRPRVVLHDGRCRVRLRPKRLSPPRATQSATTVRAGGGRSGAASTTPLRTTGLRGSNTATRNTSRVPLPIPRASRISESSGSNRN